MKTEIMDKVLAEIKENDRIILFRHIRPDGDALGSTLGLARVLRVNFPGKDIRVINSDYTSSLMFLGEEDKEVDDEFYKTALGIAVDTAVLKRSANEKYSLLKKLIKIDHHIPVEEFGDINLTDEKKSSACELVLEFCLYAGLKIDKEAATALYAGMVTDSGRFRFNSVTGDTLRYAAKLLDIGVDTDTLFANIYMRDFSDYKFEAYALGKIEMTPAGVAYIYVDEKMQKDFNLTTEGASATVDFMDEIKGSLIWLSLIENQSGTIRVRLRSRFVKINDIAEKYRGGGHAHASGATLENRSEIDALLSDLDTRLREYKENNTDFL